MVDLNNPYAPPAAAVADIAPGEGADFQPVKIFGTKGRLGRMRYFTYMLVANFIVNAVSSTIGLIIGLGAAFSGASPESMTVIGMVIAGVFALPAMVFCIMLGIQRSHDMNLSGWAMLWMLIPLAALYWLFAPGTKGPNRFGAPPPPNSTGVKVTFWVFMGLMLFGILLMALAIVLLRNFAG